MGDVLLLASGGLDSTTLAYWLVAQGHTVRPLFFDYGQHSAEKEWSTLNAVLPERGTHPPERVALSGVFRGSSSRLIEEPDLWTEAVEPESLYIPYRTLLLLAAAAARAQTLGLTDVYSAFINSNHAKEVDCSMEYLNGALALAAEVGAVRLLMPFREYSKRQVAEVAMTLDVPIGRTFSCQVYSDVPCGACPNCTDRMEALSSLGLLR